MLQKPYLQKMPGKNRSMIYINTYYIQWKISIFSIDVSQNLWKTVCKIPNRKNYLQFFPQWELLGFHVENGRLCLEECSRLNGGNASLGLHPGKKIIKYIKKWFYVSLKAWTSYATLIVYMPKLCKTKIWKRGILLLDSQI